MYFLKTKFFMYFGKWNFLVPRLKTFLYFFRKSLYLYFGRQNFLALRTFRAKEIKKKNPLQNFFFAFWEMKLSCPKLKKLLYFWILSVGRIFRNRCKINKVILMRKFLILVTASRQKKAKFSKRKMVSYNY